MTKTVDLEITENDLHHIFSSMMFTLVKTRTGDRQVKADLFNCFKRLSNQFDPEFTKFAVKQIEESENDDTSSN